MKAHCSILLKKLNFASINCSITNIDLNIEIDLKKEIAFRLYKRMYHRGLR